MLTVLSFVLDGGCKVISPRGGGKCRAYCGLWAVAYANLEKFVCKLGSCWNSCEILLDQQNKRRKKKWFRVVMKTNEHGKNSACSIQRKNFSTIQYPNQRDWKCFSFEFAMLSVSVDLGSKTNQSRSQLKITSIFTNVQSRSEKLLIWEWLI